MQQEGKNDQKDALCNCNFVSHYHWHLNNLCSQASYFYKPSWMLFWLWLLDVLHWDNRYNFIILCWLPSSNPHCESWWSRSISSPVAGLGKSLLGSKCWGLHCHQLSQHEPFHRDGHVLIQPVGPQPLSQTWWKIKATAAFYISRL